MATSPEWPFVYREEKGSPLTHAEADNNFRGVEALAQDTYALSQSAFVSAQASSASAEDSASAAGEAVSAAANAATQVGLASEQVGLASEQVALATTQAARSKNEADRAEAAAAAIDLPDPAGQDGKVLAAKNGGWVFDDTATLQPGDVIYSTRDLGDGWLPADGSLYLQSEYPELFGSVGIIPALLGHRWDAIPGLPTPAATPSCVATDGNGTWLVMRGGSRPLISRDDGESFQVAPSSVPTATMAAYTDGQWLVLRQAPTGEWWMSEDDLETFSAFTGPSGYGAYVAIAGQSGRFVAFRGGATGVNSRAVYWSKNDPVWRTLTISEETQASHTPRFTVDPVTETLYFETAQGSAGRTIRIKAGETTYAALIAKNITAHSGKAYGQQTAGTGSGSNLFPSVIDESVSGAVGGNYGFTTAIPAVADAGGAMYSENSAGANYGIVVMPDGRSIPSPAPLSVPQRSTSSGSVAISWEANPRRATRQPDYDTSVFFQVPDVPPANGARAFIKAKP